MRLVCSASADVLRQGSERFSPVGTERSAAAKNPARRVTPNLGHARSLLRQRELPFVKDQREAGWMAILPDEYVTIAEPVTNDLGVVVPDLGAGRVKLSASWNL